MKLSLIAETSGFSMSPAQQMEFEQTIQETLDQEGGGFIDLSDENRLEATFTDVDEKRLNQMRWQAPIIFGLYNAFVGVYAKDKIRFGYSFNHQANGDGLVRLSLKAPINILITPEFS